MRQLAPSDEQTHVPDDAPGWQEWWGFEFGGRGDGGLVGGLVRLALVPAMQRVWFWSVLVLPEHGVVVVRDHDVAPPRHGLAIRGDGLWAELTCETPFEHWTLGLEAFGLVLADPLDTLGGEIGDRVPVGFDLEWEVAPDASTDDDGVAYRQAGLMHGELLLARDRVEIELPSTREHGWGDPRFEPSGDDASATAGVHVRLLLEDPPTSRSTIRTLRADGTWSRMVG